MVLKLSGIMLRSCLALSHGFLQQTRVWAKAYHVNHGRHAEALISLKDNQIQTCVKKCNAVDSETLVHVGM